MSEDGQAGEARLTAKGKATRGRIVDAAAELMFAHGVARTGVEDVQKRAGVSASQLYHYFGDKRTLVRAVIARQTEAVLEAQEPLIGRLDSFEGLQAWRDVLVDLQRQRACAGGCPLGTLAAELADADPEARAELAAGFDRWEEPIRAGLRAMHERGDLRPEADPDRLALAVLAAVQGGLLLTQTRRDPEPLAVALDTVLAHIHTFAA
ncbi:MAG TPA: TetR/AcrR family transcriptional regulator [Acidimicrobiia bacterium]|nr:TetR/AcrR family transcriptional regulator [Acidimicrobiia bacterium]